MYKWVYISLMICKRYRKPFGLCLRNVSHCYKVGSRLRCLSVVSERSTHRADSIFMSNISSRISTTWYFEMCTVSAILRIFNWTFFNWRSWTFLKLSSTVIVFLASLGHGSSKTDEFLSASPKKTNWRIQHTSPFFISLRDFLFKIKYRITDRIFLTFHFSKNPRTRSLLDAIKTKLQVKFGKIFVSNLPRDN